MLALIFIAGIAQADEAKFVLKTGRLSAEGVTTLGRLSRLRIGRTP